MGIHLNHILPARMKAVMMLWPSTCLHHTQQKAPLHRWWCCILLTLCYEVGSFPCEGVPEGWIVLPLRATLCRGKSRTKLVSLWRGVFCLFCCITASSLHTSIPTSIHLSLSSGYLLCGRHWDAKGLTDAIHHCSLRWEIHEALCSSARVQERV